MQKSGAPQSCYQQVGCPRKIRKIALAVDIHANRDRNPGRAVILCVCEDISQIDLIRLPGDIDVNMPVCPVGLYIAFVEDRLICWKETDDPVRAPPVIRNDSEPCQSRSLKLCVQETVDSVLCP